MALTPEQQKQMRDSLLAKYSDASNDTSVIDAAKATEARTNDAADWGAIASDLGSVFTRARGGKGNSTDFFANMKQGAKDQLNQAQSDRTSKLSSLKDQANMNQQMLDADRGDVSFNNAQTKFGQEQAGYAQAQSDLKAAMDPNSPQSLAMQAAVKQTNPAFDVTGKSAHELQSTFPALAEGAKIGISRDEEAAKARLANAPKPLTEQQGKAATYLTRMQDASKVLNSLAPISNESLLKQQQNKAGNAILDGTVMGFPVGKLLETSGLARRANDSDSLNPDEQKVMQAQRQWSEAVLRDDSGAALPDSERKEKEIELFPQIGDSPEAIQRKAEGRKAYETALSMKLQNPQFSETYSGVQDKTTAPAASQPLHSPGIPTAEPSTNPKYAQFQKVLQDAKARGPQAEAAVHFSLQSNPDYQAYIKEQQASKPGEN